MQQYYALIDTSDCRLVTCEICELTLKTEQTWIYVFFTIFYSSYILSDHREGFFFFLNIYQIKFILSIIK